MTTADDLLRLALEEWDRLMPSREKLDDVFEGIRAYLAAPKDPMTEEEINSEVRAEKFNRCDAIIFEAGIRFAERHHGIGGADEKNT